MNVVAGPRRGTAPAGAREPVHASEARGAARPWGRTIAVLGLGYVGLPVAVAFGSGGARVIAFDVEPRRVAELSAGHDRTREVPDAELAASPVLYTTDPGALREADFFIVTVPTPLTEARQPDLGPLLRASETVGRALRPGAIVVYESTVYPGATEEECVPVLERASGLRAGRDFSVAYSPERMNPGDPGHRFGAVAKVVSAQTPAALDEVARLYARVVPAGVHRAPSIRVAEAAKVIENAQRDLNIAFVNELARIFDRLDLDTRDVLDAAATKWNFLPFSPGLVGGHCIGIDPFYLTHRAERAGYHPEVILAGRRINDSMGAFVARRCIRMLMRQRAAERLVTVLGVTFKENVPDLRNSPVVGLIGELRAHDVHVQVVDPLADPDDVLEACGVRPTPANAARPSQAVVLAVAHEPFVRAGWNLVLRCLRDARGAVLDVKGCLDRAARPPGVDLWRL